ncbi:MAG: DUF928 domain-containing protein [Leptolyngbya sp. SIO3F4]|nr:DUF928 domain-containing protein [Leptolyngbya sp. SIO3F4]
MAETQLLLSKTLDDSTDTDTDTGNRTAGGSLEGNCEEVDIPLTAIRPLYRRDRLTQRQNPTLSFYVPYKGENISNLEFLLLPKDESHYIYETSLLLESSPGIVSITFDLPSGISQDELTDEFRWYVNITCENKTGSSVELSVDGWIQYTNTGEANLPYYDLVADNIAQIQVQPGRSDLRMQWAQTLESIDSLSVDEFPDKKVAELSLFNALVVEKISIPNNCMYEVCP